MTLGTSIDTPSTVRSLCTAALVKAGVTAIDETPSEEDINLAARNMGYMLRTWEVDGLHLWSTEEQNLPLVAGQAAYSVTPRILALPHAYLVYPQGNRTPIRVVTREQFERLPYPAGQGTPYWCWLDRQRTTTVLTVYPVPNQAGLSLDLTVSTPLIDPTNISQELDAPPEWQEGIIYNLAARLCDDNGRGGEVAQRVIQRAGQLKAMLDANDREPYTRFRARR